ncbi:diguanylate cyclase domain-containing protein [Singulisphaera sp. PoT]|uniref:diguanylate cyclase domain-containing protein n=1 Tax=Singulisphaera sp. PoT TaxID=3411797 RepID=UPI003BF4EB00
MADRTVLPPSDSREFFQKTIDSLLGHIAILDREGVIVSVNRAWDQFAFANGLDADRCGPGVDYLRTCDEASGNDAEEGAQAAEGIRDVLAGRVPDFELEYPCHSPSERRWFTVRASRFAMDGEVYVVVCHDNITRRKLSELMVMDMNRSLEFQANHDGLTGIPNRRAFDNTFGREWSAHLRARSFLSVAILDIDFFKQFNDREGHLAGDDCLRLIAQVIASSLNGEEHFACRYGGEEFALILPHRGVDPAARVVRDIQMKVRELQLPHPASPVGGGILTVSAGLATTVPDEDVTAAQVLEQADKALYLAKSLGRDKLVHAIR